MRGASTPDDRAAVRVYGWLAAQVLATAGLVAFEESRGRALAEQISLLGGDPRAPGAEAVLGQGTVFAMLVIALAVTTAGAAVSYLAWLHRVVGPAAVRAWLVPGVNLVTPPLVLYRSRPGGRWPPWGWPALLAAWWVSWLAVLALFAVRLSPGGGAERLTGLGPLELGVTVLAAAGCAAVVREVTRRPSAHRVAPPRLRAMLRLAGPCSEPRPVSRPGPPRAPRQARRGQYPAISTQPGSEMPSSRSRPRSGA